MIQKKKIDISMEQNPKTSASTNLISNNSTTIDIDFQVLSQDKINSSCSTTETVNCFNKENLIDNTNIMYTE